MSDLTPAESRDLRCIAGMIIPASMEFDVPGADDATIFADIVGTIGRDLADMREALSAFAKHAGGAFADLDAARREDIAASLRAGGGAAMATLSRVILQC